MKKFISILKFITNKYLIAFVIFGIAITITENHNAFQRIENIRTIKKLEKEIAFFRDKKNQNINRLKQLQSGPEQIEKFARERYRMHASNEDVFVLE